MSLRSLETREQLDPDDAVSPEQSGRTRVALGAKVLVPIVVLAGGVFAASYLLATAPKAERTRPARQARLVDVLEAERVDARVLLRAMGPVTAAREVEMQPQVAGEVVEVSEEVVPGGLFKAGQLLMRIDPRDYELAVRERVSDLAQAERDLKLEMGQQLVARREYELLGEVIADEDVELVLRMPQLASARQRVEAAKAALEDARLDLERTEIVAPFNAIVRAKHVDRGAIVTPNSLLATLVGTDEYWIEVSVPVDDLKWITIPRRGGEEGSPVRISNEAAWGKGVHRVGQVLRLAGDLEEEGRMARLLVTVADPMSLEPENASVPILLIGSYVRVEIEGSELASVVSLDRNLLRDGDAVWVVTEGGGLEIRPVQVAYRGRDHVFVSRGISAGERLVVTDLSAPVAGMPLRVRAVRTAGTRDDAAKTGDDAGHEGAAGE